MLTMLSFPHRLHLIGRFLISVSGSNHSTVCLPHMGHRKRRRSTFISSSAGFCCNLFCKMKSPRSCALLCQPQKRKACTIIAFRDSMAQALRLRLKATFVLCGYNFSFLRLCVNLKNNDNEQHNGYYVVLKAE